MTKTITMGISENHRGDTYELFNYTDYPYKKLEISREEWSEYVGIRQALFDIERDWDKRAEKGGVRFNAKDETYKWESK